MISLDTNILLRYALDDHATLSPIARSMLEERDCFVPLLALAEAGYVLQSLYQASGVELLAFAKALLESPRLSFESEERLPVALAGFKAGVDWFDAMLWASCPTTRPLATLDRKFARKAAALGWQPPVQSFLP